jgi:hypothetical protein
MGYAPGGRFYGLGKHARRRLQLLLVPLAVAGAVTLATPQAASAASGAIETGSTTYVVNPEKNEIDVTVTYAIKNTTKSKSRSVTCYSYFTCNQTTSYYFNTVYFLVDAGAGPVSVTSNAGKVSQAPQADAPSSTRGIKLTYPAVWYGQTRVVTARYAILAGPKATSFYMALKSYAHVCARNNVWTTLSSSSVNIVLPAGFAIADAGILQTATSKDGATTLSTTADVNWSNSECIDAVNPAGLETSSVSAGKTTVAIQSWPEDTDWKTRLTGILNQDVSKIEDMTGLPMDSGPYALAEAGSSEVGVAYASDTNPTVRVSSGATDSVIIEAIATHGYAGTFTEPWMAAGLAGYTARSIGEGTCTKPSRAVVLEPWHKVALATSSVDLPTRMVQAGAACAVFTEWAKDVGPDRFKAALVAASRGENPYANAATVAATATQPISPQLLLDMIDERGMIPSGIGGLDDAQSLLVGSGVFDETQLQARATARAQYHALATTAATWSLPPVIRNAMAAWDFTAATNAMKAASQILALRDQSQKAVTGLKLDGTKLQEGFESAATQADLDALLTLAKSESDAASKIAEASQLEGSGKDILQSIGLVGSNVSGRMDQARSSLAGVKPADATNSAQGVIDDINQSSIQGILRVVVILVALLALVFAMFRRRRRRLALAPAGVLDQANAFGPSAPDGLTPSQPTLPEGMEPPATSGESGLPQAAVAETPSADPAPPAAP